MLKTAKTLLPALLVASLMLPAVAADKNATFIDPAKAGPDFKAQGEYAGEVVAQDKTVKVGVQVIALGDGKFQAVAYAGGLPGAGWDGSDVKRVDGETIDGVPTFSDGEKPITGKITDGALTVTKADGTEIIKLKKVERKSPTLGAKPPEGAVVLFDGTSPDAFQGGRMSEDGLLMEGSTSKEKFPSFTLHLEFSTPFKPAARGQGRGNSGFYAQGRYEVQVLDSFGLEGRNNECGGIYGIKDPDVNMCLPPLVWQTYDAKLTAPEYNAAGEKTKNARLTLRHNGVVIHDYVELPHDTPGRKKEGPGPRPFHLQGHGNHVQYRNIWLVPK